MQAKTRSILTAKADVREFKYRFESFRKAADEAGKRCKLVELAIDGIQAALMLALAVMRGQRSANITRMVRLLC
jgi:hypothetical protein